MTPSGSTEPTPIAPNVEELFRDHHGELFRYASLLLGDPDAAKDIVQEAFMRLQERPPRRDENLRSWLFRVATNLVRDEAKIRSRRRKLLMARADTDPAAPDPLARLERAQAQSIVREALASLREKERVALLMRSSGFTHREIADAVGTTTKSVGTLIARSLDKLSLALNHLAEHTP